MMPGGRQFESARPDFSTPPFCGGLSAFLPPLLSKVEPGRNHREGYAMSNRVKFGLGIAAGLLAIAVMFFMRYTMGVPTVPELVQDSVVQLFPGELASSIIDRLQKAAKVLLFASLIAIQLGILGLCGVLSLDGSKRDTPPGSPPAAAPAWLRRPWKYPMAWVLLWWGLVMAVFLPNAGLGFAGSATSNGWVVTALAALGPPLTFGLGLMLGGELIDKSRSRQGAAADLLTAGLDRRRFLGLSLATVVAATLGGSLVKRLVTEQGSATAPLAMSPGATSLEVPPTPTPTVIGHPGTPGVPASQVPERPPTTAGTQLLDGLVNPYNVLGFPSEVTSNKDFYVVSKNVIDPTVQVKRWSLTVGGMVDAPFQLTYDELRALPATSQLTTLICISNPIGGPLIGNAKWTGVRLEELLERAKLKPGVKDIALHAADGYSDSITLGTALKPTMLVAYAMNDEPLPMGHGAPVRLVVPGIYGMKNVKWLTRIEATNEDFKGFWERKGWSDIAIIKTMSRIDVPSFGKVDLGKIAIGGIAFAGDRGVAAIEWSTDGGITWKKASVKPALSPSSWVLWADEWNPQNSGRVNLQVRAIDSTGEVQIAEVTDPYPDGATGYHKVNVRLG
jgi:DMSO/TMAO reductase YedYZ molybdopterin-dependent catalytic subunit